VTWKKNFAAVRQQGTLPTDGVMAAAGQTGDTIAVWVNVDKAPY